jgi:hypothetical protein
MNERHDDCRGSACRVVGADSLTSPNRPKQIIYKHRPPHILTCVRAPVCTFIRCADARTRTKVHNGTISLCVTSWFAHPIPELAPVTM